MKRLIVTLLIGLAIFGTAWGLVATLPLSGHTEGSTYNRLDVADAQSDVPIRLNLGP